MEMPLGRIFLLYQVGRPTYKLLLKKEKAHDMDVNAVQWSSKTVDSNNIFSSSQRNRKNDGTVKDMGLNNRFT